MPESCSLTWKFNPFHMRVYPVPLREGPNTLASLTNRNLPYACFPLQSCFPHYMSSHGESLVLLQKAFFVSAVPSCHILLLSSLLGHSLNIPCSSKTSCEFLSCRLIQTMYDNHDHRLGLRLPRLKYSFCHLLCELCPFFICKMEIIIGLMWGRYM